MPYFLAVFKIPENLGIQVPMRIRDKANAGQKFRFDSKGAVKQLCTDLG
jgi:hypothetical protein